LKDFVPGKSATLVKNPDYWGHDERYPQNQLPYLDSIKFLIIPDDNEALEMMRAGKIDIMDRVFQKQAKSIQKTNPEILQIFIPRPRLLPYNRETTGRRLRIYGCAWRCKWRSTCRPSQKSL